MDAIWDETAFISVLDVRLDIKLDLRACLFTTTNVSAVEASGNVLGAELGVIAVAKLVATVNSSFVSRTGTDITIIGASAASVFYFTTTGSLLTIMVFEGILLSSESSNVNHSYLGI